MNEIGDRLDDLAREVVERLPAVLAEVRELLADQHPDYAAFLTDDFHEVVTAAGGFVVRLVGLAGPDVPASGRDEGVEHAVFEEIGRIHHRQGRDVNRLLEAYRIGATVLWRHVSDAAIGLSIPVQEFAALAGAVFAAVDQLSAASRRGYVEEQADAAYARDRLREELAALLLSDRSDTAAVRAAAKRAAWPLPRQASVVLAHPDNDVARELLAHLDGSTLHLRRPDARIAILPDPAAPGRRHRLASALRGTAAVVGVPVPLDELPASLRLAQLAIRLQREHVVDDAPLFVDQHLDAIIVHQDEALLAALRRQHLAPLAGLPPPARERLSATLASWLMNMGDRRAVAGELHVHPQTVRYRLAQLRELFGPALDDPRFRANLLLALGWGPAAEPVAGPDVRADP